MKLHHARELSEHVRHSHVEPMASQDVFVCLWEGCKVFNKASCSHSWLSKHINTHTGDKPFKCMISGCSLSFSSQEGLARHVPTHFNEPKPPKRQQKDNESPKKVFKKRRLKFIRPRRAPEPGKKQKRKMKQFGDSKWLPRSNCRILCVTFTEKEFSHVNFCLSEQFCAHCFRFFFCLHHVL